MGAHAAYIYVSAANIIAERIALQKAVDEAYAAKLIGKDNIHGYPFDCLCASRRGCLYLR